jgi:hypothetical protein
LTLCRLWKLQRLCSFSVVVEDLETAVDVVMEINSFGCGGIVEIVDVAGGSVVEVSGALGTSFHEGRMVLSLADPHGLSPVNKGICNYYKFLLLWLFSLHD